MMRKLLTAHNGAIIPIRSRDFVNLRFLVQYSRRPFNNGDDLFG
jgi:hypothetical protein